MQKKILAGGETPCGNTLSTTIRTIVWGIAGLVLVGCDVPSTSHPIARGEQRSPLPQSDRAAVESLPLDGRVTLPEALAHAERHAPPMLIAASEVGMGEAEVEAARQMQPFNPTVSVGLGRRRQAGGTGLDAQVALEQQLEIAGQRKTRKESARLFREMTVLGLDAAAWSVHAEVHWAFERALLAEERLALTRERVAIAEELLRMAQRRVEVGDESTVVVQIAIADLALARNSETAARTQVDTSRTALALATGSTTLAALRPVGTLDPPAPTGGGAALADAAEETNPSLQKARAATRVADADLAAARREAWPSPTVGVSFAREGSTSTPGNSSPGSTIWMGTLQIPIPAFSRNQGAVARSRAQVRVAEARQRAAAVRFNSMVGAAATRVDAAARRTAALETGVIAAFEGSVAALRRAYEVGELNFVDVARALERLWVAREQALAARASYYDAFADLERLVGPLDHAERAAIDRRTPAEPGDDR